MTSDRPADAVLHCGACGGRGDIDGRTCPNCNGSGEHSVERVSMPGEDRLRELQKQHYGSNPTMNTADWLFLLAFVAVAGLAGVYAGRWFVGWPAQIAGGLFTGLLAFAGLLSLQYVGIHIYKRVSADVR